MTEITSQLSTALADRYRIESHLGEGGMATVYLAHDVKHDRKVALKVLRPELAAVIGAERFLQEIKVTANLQHPHILPLHDSGEAGSFLFYVMPYVEGDTLRDKLDRERQLDIMEAIEITRSVASALDYAHRQGVIHRDIKPENVLIHDGQALVADFGIALAVSEASGQRLTETGLSIGTPHYMSPEQAMGDRELDARSDIYSVGAMLFEMLAGEPPYQGSTAQAVVAKVITEKAPPVTAARDTVPGHVAAAIAKALQKMPADRFKTAAAFADALTNPAFTAPSATAATGVATTPVAARRAVPTWLFAATAVLAVAAVVLLGLRGVMGGPSPAVTRFTVDLGDELVIAPTALDRLDISPDGSRLAMLVALEGQMAIVVRAMDQLDVTVVPRTEGARNPTFSPDNEWLAFRQEGAIRKVRLAGGTPLTLAEDAGWLGMSWGKDGTIVFMTEDGLRRIPEAGGPVDTLTSAGGETHLYPYQLPNGRGVIFTVGSSNEEARIAVVDIASGHVTELLEGVRARYVSTGHLVYASADGGVLAAPFDQDRLEVVGSPVPLLEGVSVTNARSARFTVADNGTLVYQTGGAGGSGQIVRVERDGGETVVVEPLRDYAVPRYSPDGSRVAVQLEGDIWIHDVQGGTATRLTVEGANQTPVWSADGSRVAFGSVRNSAPSMWWRVVDGSAPAEHLVETRATPHPGGWTPDGRRLVYRTSGEGTGRDLWALTLDGDSGAAPYLATDFQETAPALSPDGRWLAYMSNETDRWEVYVRAFPESGGRIPVSMEGGFEPLWSRDGTELYYRSSGNLVAAEVELTPTFRVVRREVLFDAGGYRPRVLAAGYDVHPDGSFLFVRQEGGSSTTTTVVLNWLEELKEAVGR